MVLNSRRQSKDPCWRSTAITACSTRKTCSTERVARAVNSRDVARDGMTLDQLGKVLSAYTLTVHVTHASDSDPATSGSRSMRPSVSPTPTSSSTTIARALSQRRVQDTSRPLPRTMRQTDRYLIMDVARYRYPPVWVGAEELWSAMHGRSMRPRVRAEVISSWQSPRTGNDPISS